MDRALFDYGFIRRQRIFPARCQAPWSCPWLNCGLGCGPAEPGIGPRRCASPVRSDHRDRHPDPPRCAAVRTIPYLGDRRARHHLDSRWAGSDARRRAVGGTQARHRLRIEQCANRVCGQQLSRRRGARCLLFRLVDRPPGTKKAVHHYACGLSPGHRGDRPVLGCTKLCVVPFPDRRRHWRRIHCHQFDNPGAYSGAVPGLDRPSHQRQFLGRRRRWRGGVAHSARSRR